jgi:hypothetical protein
VVDFQHAAADEEQAAASMIKSRHEKWSISVRDRANPLRFRDR